MGACWDREAGDMAENSATPTTSVLADDLAAPADCCPEWDPHDKNLGKKTIGRWSSVALEINNITGPGILTLPYMFKEAGWCVPLIVFVLVTILSSLSCTTLCEAMSRIPGNSKFKRRVEFNTVFQH